MIKTPLSTMVGGAGIWTPGCTVIGSQKTLTQLIKSLFANNEQGFTRTPDDLTTLYQDAAGTVPVTGAGQPVGLVLDKSKGLVVGSNFNVMSQWGATLCFTYTAPNLLMSNTSGSIQYPQRPILTTGKWYKVSVTCSSVTGTIRFANQGGVIISTALIIGTTSACILATDKSLVWVVDNNSTATITGFTIQEFAGNHAYQITSSMRPLLVASPQRLDFDTVDDKLDTNLPAQLTGCTVIRSVPNVGTQILTGQTIAATYKDNQDHCGLIVINRALTATETAQITRLFNKAAGV